ncbi:MAG: hypothetical protein H6662_19735, partial [Ardenticatenaceae bacterium]|nr:hypothetical protein [Ardenticatenaceae bacterium]
TFRQLIGLRSDHVALRRGEVATLLVDDANGLYSYMRAAETETAVVILSNRVGGGTAVINLAAYLPDGTVLTDVLNNDGAVYTVSGGQISVPVSGQWGRVLVTDAAPITPTPTATPSATPTASMTPTPTASATPTMSVTPTPTTSSTPTSTASATPTASVTPSLTPSVMPSPTITPTPVTWRVLLPIIYQKAP